MILIDKDISDATALKLVSKQLRKVQSTKGFRLKTRRGERTLTYDELIQFVDELAARLSSGEYGVIRRCETCGNFSKGGAAGSHRGWCFPKEHTSFRDCKDHCSRWIPRDEKQKQLDERISTWGQ